MEQEQLQQEAELQEVNEEEVPVVEEASYIS